MVDPGQRLEMWVRPLFPNLLPLLPVSGGRREIRGDVPFRLPVESIPRDGEWPRDLIPGSKANIQ